MIGDLVLAGLGLIQGIKEQAILLTESSGTVDPVWKTKAPGSPVAEDVFDLYVIEDVSNGESVGIGGIDVVEEMEYLSFIKIELGQQFQRATGENFQVVSFEALPGVSKELYLGKARLVQTGQRS